MHAGYAADAQWGVAAACMVEAAAGVHTESVELDFMHAAAPLVGTDSRLLRVQNH